MWAIEGVEGVHCLHVWALTTGKFLASAHVRVAEGTHDNVLAHVERVLATHLGDACHTTIQVRREAAHCSHTLVTQRSLRDVSVPTRER